MAFMVSAERARKAAYVLCRYFVALVLCIYGFGKITGTQFQTPLVMLERPVGELSGFALTWYYFGYSEAYGTIIALVQIVGGALLLFRKTTLLGACVLFGVMCNIVLINIFYNIGNAWIAAFLLTGCLLFILSQHRGELVRLFWTAQNKAFPSRSAETKKLLLKNAVRVCVVALPLLLAIQLSTYHPTPISGAWNVAQVRGKAEATALPERIYFESAYAYMSYFWYEDGIMNRQHYEVNPDADEATGELDIWSNYLSKGAKIFTGRYRVEGDTLWLRGRLNQDSVRLVLTRRDLGIE